MHTKSLKAQIYIQVHVNNPDVKWRLHN